MALEQNMAVAAKQKNLVKPPGSPILQRACACGKHTGSGGECAECRKKRLGLKHQAVSESRPAIAAPIVHEVLRSPGHSLDPAMDRLNETHFHADFSQVRVHPEQNMSQEVLVPHQAGGAAGGGAAGGAAGQAVLRSHRFTAEGVNVVVRRNCENTLGLAAVEAGTRTALDRIFNTDCIEESRRIRIQRNLTRHGLDIRCAVLANACAEATGFFIPANIMTLNSDRTNCPPLESSILHEIIHLTRGIYAEGLPESCDNSCLGTQRGAGPEMCRDIDVFGQRRLPVGDFPPSPEDLGFA
jgi:hypothetical protein